MTTLELEPTKHGEVVVLAPKGSLNTETSPRLEQKVVELLNASERWFAVDLAGVDYISSAGLRVLLMMARRLRAAAGAMVLCALNHDVAKVFALCGFEREFTIVPTRDEAFARLFAGTASADPGGAPGALPEAQTEALPPAAPPRERSPDAAIDPGPAAAPPAPASATGDALTAAVPSVPASLGEEMRRVLSIGLSAPTQASAEEKPPEVLARVLKALTRGVSGPRR
jgi:anti-anti-sigma factor